MTADDIERAERGGIFKAMDACPHYIDYRTAWAIQHSHGDQLEHHPRCSSTAGLLCDCSAMEDEWHRIKALRAKAQSDG